MTNTNNTPKPQDKVPQNKTQAKWDNIYAGSREMDTPAARVLTENTHLLPKSDSGPHVGLELACGLAANSFELARHGIAMQAWDISQVVVDKVNQHAAELKLPVSANAIDQTQQTIPENSFDIIIASRYLERPLFPAIIKGLKPNGLIFFQTYTQTKVSDGGPNRDEWRLADGELLEVFKDFQVLVYREEGVVGDTSKGFRNEAYIVARKLN